MKKLILLSLIVSRITFGSVQVMFHPHDPTLASIAQTFMQARKSAQIVLYNIDVTKENPVIQAIQSDAFKKKLAQGFQVQMIYEGYGTAEEKHKRMQDLESLGIDVRYLGSSKKIHHKFAVFDSGLPTERLITGSANWSMGSFRNYDENILFIENEPGIISQFAQEFTLLWTQSQEYGSSWFPEVQNVKQSRLKGDLHSFFNSPNFIWTRKGPQNPQEMNPLLTKTVVASIEHAKKTIEVASARIKLAPIHAALVRAAQRGVKIRIVVSQAEYTGSSSREKIQLRDCGNDLFHSKCSVGVNFSPLLDPSSTGFENMQLRLKFFNLDLANNITHQMHNKYMIIDGRWILSGSFNWSNSSEWQHIENVVVIDGSVHKQVRNRFLNNFNYLWNMNREQRSLQSLVSGGCFIKPTMLTFQEIDTLRKSARAMGSCIKK